MEQTIKDKSPKPPGLVPKNLQAFILVGLALLMVIVMAVTGHKRPVPTGAAGSTPSLPNLVPVNSEKVNDFQKAIEQTQRESAPQVEAALLQEQKQLAAQGTRPAQPFPSNPYGTPVISADPNGAYPPGAYAATIAQPVENQSIPDPVKEEEKKRSYLSQFSDNVALTYRKDLKSQNPPFPSTNPPQADLAFPTPGLPDSAEDRLVAQAAAEFVREGQRLDQLQPSHPAPAQPLNKDQDPVRDSLRSLPSNGDQAKVKLPAAFEAATISPHHEGHEYVLFEGTVLEALLINRLDGTFAGPLSCLLSTNIYSHDRQHLLIPAGSKILGEASKVETFGQARLAVTFHRLMMPDGYSVSLDQFKGLDQEGATALTDKVNNHYARIFGASLAVGILGGVAQLGTSTTLDSSATDRIREGFGVGMANSGEHILDRFLNILPTVTIREGSRIKIYLSNDLLLPDYAAHTIPTNF